MIKAKISPSMMCMDFTNMKEQVKALESANVEFFHIDVMDGHFVPNLMLCNEIVKALRSLSSVPFDFHFMVEKPLDVIKWYQIKDNDVVSIHFEALDNNFDEIKKYIHSLGAKLFIAINPDTKVDVLKPLIDRIDCILVMTVVPGFAGAKLVPYTLDKIKEARELFDLNGYKNKSIEVDGNVSYPNSTIMRKKGADMFVGGTSSIFKKELGIEAGVSNLRDFIKQGE